MGYTNYNMQYVAPYSLETVDKVLSGLQQRHEDTIEKSNALKATIANLDLNEAESEYRDSLVQNIEDTIEANSIDGFEGYAYNDILKLSGNLASDKGLLGRLNAQKEYRAFTEAVDKSNEFGQDVKNWSKDINRYYYDEKNNGKWKPTIAPTKQIDLNSIFAIAKQYIIPQEGSYSQVRYYNRDGSITNTFDPQGTIDIFDTISGKWEKVSEQQVRDGLAAAINGSPEIRASIEQDYEVTKWKDSKIKNNDNYVLNEELYNNDGTLKTFDEYIEDRFSPFIRQQTYYHNFSQTTPNQYLFRGSKNNNSGLRGSTGNDLLSFANIVNTTLATQGNLRAYKNTDYSDAQHSVFELNGYIRQGLVNNHIFKNKAINYNKIDINNIQGSIDYLKEQSKTNPAITEQFINSFQNELENIYNNNYSAINLNNEVAQKHPEKLSKFRLRNNIANGDPINMNDNDISEEDRRAYGGFINDVFRENNVVNAFKTVNEYQNALAELEEQGFANNVTKGKFKDGTYYIGLNRENSNLLLPFINAINNNTKSNFGWNNDGEFKAKSYKIKNEYEETKINGLINNFIRYYNKLDEQSSIPEEELYQTTTNVPGATPIAAQMFDYSVNPNVDSQDRNNAAKLADNINTQIKELFKVSDFTALGLEKYDENEVYSKLTSKEQKELQAAIIGSSSNYDINITGNISNDEQEWQIQFNIVPKKDPDKNKPFTVVTTSKNLGKYIPAIAEFNNNEDIGITRKLNKSIRSRIPIDIGYEKGVDITNHYQLKSVGNNYFDVLSNGDSIGTIKIEEAKQFVKIYNDIRQIAPYIKQGLMTREDANKIINNLTNTIQALQNVCGVPVFSKDINDSVIDMIGL